MHADSQGQLGDSSMMGIGLGGLPARHVSLHCLQEIVEGVLAVRGEKKTKKLIKLKKRKRKVTEKIKL